MKPNETKKYNAGKAGSVETKELRSLDRRAFVRPKSKLSLVVACMAMSLLLVNCSGEYSPVSPTPVVGEIGVNPPIDLPTPVVGGSQIAARESFTYHVNGVAYSKLRLEGVNGWIRIEGGSDSENVLVTGDRIVKSQSDDDARRRLEYLEVRIEELGGELAVRTVQPENTNGRSYEVNYTISLPNSWSVEVGAVNGNVTLSNVHGGARVELINGGIEGDLVLPMDGEIDLQTVNGKIGLRIPESTSAELSASVVNGSIDVSGLELRDARETRTSLRATLGEGRGWVTLRTTNGKISVEAF